ncbi:MAG TPA: hypothetical protein VLH58_02000 [Candidatus Methylomirabilis sp.]|nr:hypothetical protein [Candidatus Methylomirabilis sp.]HSC70095.1 hypothetical protein [Candidatus Methylomirabilis sp.]
MTLVAEFQNVPMRNQHLVEVDVAVLISDLEARAAAQQPWTQTWSPAQTQRCEESDWVDEQGMK